MTIDGGLRSIFHDKLRAGFHWVPVETGDVGMGVPDSNYCALRYSPEPVGSEGWVEYKQTSGWDVTLRPEQIGWLVKRSMMGGRVFVATRRRHDGGPRKGPAVDELWLHWGGHARELKDGGLQAAPVYSYQQGGPSNWDWDWVREVLLTKGLSAPS